MSRYESKGFARYCLRTVARRSGFWLVLFLFMGLSMADMAQYAGLAEGASTATGAASVTAATGAISGKILDQGGQPLANIQVLALNQSTTAVTGGYFSPPPYGLSLYPPWTSEGLNMGDFGDYAYYGAYIYTPYGYGYSYGNTGLPPTDTSSLYRSSSKADGTFLLSNLPEGRYSLWAYDPQDRGFVPVIFGLNDIGAGSGLPLASYYPYSLQNNILIKVKSGQTAGPFNMVMSRGGKLSGRITDADTGLPIKGAIIQAYSQLEGGGIYSSNNLPLLASSDLNGDFTFCGLAEGKFQVSVSMAEGYITVTDPGQYYPPFEENIYSVVAGQETSGCNLALKRSGMISGKVTSQADGKPVAGASVSVVVTGGSAYTSYQAPVISGADGTYHINIQEPGTYVPMVQYAPGFQNAYYPNTRDQNQAREIQVELGKEIASIDFQLLPSKTAANGTIRGRIIDKQSGLGVAGIQVSLNRVYVSDSSAAYPPYSPYGTTYAYPPYGTMYSTYGGAIMTRNRADTAASDSTPVSAPAVNAPASPDIYAATAYATAAYATTASAPAGASLASEPLVWIAQPPSSAPADASSTVTAEPTATLSLTAMPATAMPYTPPDDTIVLPTLDMPTDIGYSSYGSTYGSTYAPYTPYTPIPVEPFDYPYILPPLPDFYYTSTAPVWTDQEGKFEFTGLEYGKYSLDTYDPAGWYLPVRYPQYYAMSGQTMLPYVDLSEEQSTSEDMEITLARGGRLEGKVLAGSTPLAGVQVRAIRTSQDNSTYPYGIDPTTGYPYGGLYGGYASSYSSYYPSPYSGGYGSTVLDITDTAGEFSICGLEEGEYVLLVENSLGSQSQNYMTTYCVDSNLTSAQEKPRTFIITTGSTFTDLVISMKTGGSISGKVVDKTGKPLAGITVSAEIDPAVFNPAGLDPAGSDPAASDQNASLYYSSQPTKYAMTSGDGTYTVTGLSEGTYIVRAADNSESREYQGDCCSGLKVTPPATVFAPDLVLPKSLVLCGKVTSQDGKPVADIRVSASPDRSQVEYYYSNVETGEDQNGSSCSYQTTYGSAYTAGDGTYRITGLLSGSYQLEAYDPADEYLRSEAGTGSSPGLITGVEGEVKTSLDLHLTKGGTIKGIIRDAATGKPISNVTVTAQLEPAESSGTYGRGQVYSSISSDKEGNYNLHGLPAGKYRVYITDATGKNYMPQYYAGASSMNEATVLEVNTAQTLENIDFMMSAGIILRGTVRDNTTGQPITLGAGMVTLNDEHGQGVKQAYTSGLGEYKFSGICPGTYSIEVADSQYYHSGSYLHATNETQAGIPAITISLPGPVECVDILLWPKASISGRVVDEFDQKPLANITITAVWTMGRAPSYFPYRPLPAITDADGRYTVKGLDEGAYVIMATDYSHIYGSEYYKDVLPLYSVGADYIVLSKSENKEGIDMELQVGETYTGADTSPSSAYYPTTTGYYYSTSPYVETYSGLYGSGLYGSSNGLYGSSLYGSSYGAAPAASAGYAGSTYYASSSIPDPYAQAVYGGLPSTVSTQSPAGTAGNIPAPEIISSNTVENITAGRTFTYQVKVNDSASNTPLKYSLALAPEGMNLDQDSGLVQWKPSNDDAGQAIVQLKVDNGSGQVALQAFRLGVEADTTPPEEVTDLTAAKGDRKVTISWKPSTNSDEDLADQILYVQAGNAPHGSGISLGKDTTKYTVENLENGKACTFKITTTDELANESSGVTAVATPAKEQAVSTGNQPTSPYPLTEPGSGLFSPARFNIGNASNVSLWGVLPSSVSLWSVLPSSFVSQWSALPPPVLPSPISSFNTMWDLSSYTALGWPSSNWLWYNVTSLPGPVSPASSCPSCVYYSLTSSGGGF